MPGVVNRESSKCCTHVTALTVEETVSLVSGMSVSTIRGRNSNPIFIKRQLNITESGEKSSKQRPLKEIMILGKHQSQTDELRGSNSSKKQEPKALPGEVLTSKALEKLNQVF